MGEQIRVDPTTMVIDPVTLRHWADQMRASASLIATQVRVPPARGGWWLVGHGRAMGFGLRYVDGVEVFMGAAGQLDALRERLNAAAVQVAVAYPQADGYAAAGFEQLRDAVAAPRVPVAA